MDTLAFADSTLAPIYQRRISMKKVTKGKGCPKPGTESHPAPQPQPKKKSS
jgi:hypothetical protein